MKRFKIYYLILLEVLCFILLSFFYIKNEVSPDSPSPDTSVPEDDGPYPTLPQYTIEESYETTSDGKNFIKWVDFKVTCEALEDAYEQDVATYGQDIHLNWIELLAYLATSYGGDFSKYKKSDMKKLADSLLSGETTMEELSADRKYYDYYYEAYSAVLGGMVGEYEIETEKEAEGGNVWEQKYGLKCYLPIAKNFPYSDYDDFGASRSYGYKRLHLGHDMLGQVGTPIIAVESGYVEALGWNEFGGWRIGIRSFDGKRYYYYAHLRKNFPYNKSLTVGSVVTAGDVIGYLGRTGYSKTENTNNIETAHLHFGLQLIFDESQKECDSEIWIDCYELILFLYRNRSETEKNLETKEWSRILKMRDPLAEEYKKVTENTENQAEK
ncbi:MAG: M23 family metallopeptidase [Lachnospiraceae bacterium]